jgi:hypothetical protein
MATYYHIKSVMGEVASKIGEPSDRICGYGITEEQALSSLNCNLAWNYEASLKKDEVGYYVILKSGKKIYCHSSVKDNMYMCYLY